jgi:hypothetical protein
MFLHISDRMTIEEVQDRFHECFPSLELVFYPVPFKKTAPVLATLQLEKDVRIEYVRQYHYNGVLEIKSWFPVAKVEKELKELFDLNAHICRVDANGQLLDAAASDELLPKQ